MAENNSESMKITLFVLGNSRVGKTCFLNRYVKNEFMGDHITTIGIDYLSKSTVLPNGKKVQILFYDTAGQERYQTIAFNLVKNADGIMLMYDITDMKTFEDISGWIKSIREIKGDDFPIVLIGNKCDLKDERVVDKEDGEELATKNGFLFFETSCKDNINVEESINAIASKVNKEEEIITKGRTISLDKLALKEQKKKCDC